MTRQPFWPSLVLPQLHVLNPVAVSSILSVGEDEVLRAVVVDAAADELHQLSVALDDDADVFLLELSVVDQQVLETGQQAFLHLAAPLQASFGLQELLQVQRLAEVHSTARADEKAALRLLGGVSDPKLAAYDPQLQLALRRRIRLDFRTQSAPRLIHAALQLVSTAMTGEVRLAQARGNETRPNRDFLMQLRTFLTQSDDVEQDGVSCREADQLPLSFKGERDVTTLRHRKFLQGLDRKIQTGFQVGVQKTLLPQFHLR